MGLIPFLSPIRLSNRMSGLRPPSKLRPPKKTSEKIQVGTRVNAAGKLGIIAFLGETQFASGQWAGIVLDEAVGKNDGSVNGVSYFQTAEKRGIFLRPEKLEIETPNQPTSPAPASPTQRADSESDAVRFAGTTEFKEGIWVGIELNEPVGKNDGSVMGVQYFKCPPKFGLFALPHKVQKIKVNKVKSPM